MSVLLLIGGTASAHARSEGDVSATACTITQDRSSPSTTAATILFVNETGGTVNVYWLAFDGSRQLYFRLAAGQSQSQATYIGHAWLVTDSAGSCVGYVVADQAQKRYVIAGSAPRPPSPTAPRGKTIVGGPKADVLKGTGKADRIYGRDGNDKLYGLAGDDFLDGGKGNDLLVGGLGKDRIRCGLGRDTALAGAGDTIASDCEVVKGLPKPPPPPPTPPPPPPPVAAPHVGHYAGTTSQGKPISFDILSDGRSLVNLSFDFDAPCQPPSTSFFGPTTISGTYPVQPGGTVSVPLRGAGTTLSGAVYTATGSVQGSFDASGAGTGTLQLHIAADQAGTHWECDTGTVTWSAR